jgi:cysteine desulfuration protein SufE
LTIKDIQEQIVEEFSFLEEWMDKYEHIIELGKELPKIDDAHKVDENLIKGCQSQVWLHAERNPDNTLRFSADSDAIITKGLVAMVIRVLDGQNAAEIAQTDLTFVRDIGLNEHLSPTRSNGLVSMINRMKLYGIQHAVAR